MGEIGTVNQILSESFMKITEFFIETLVTLVLAHIEDRLVGQNQGKMEGNNYCLWTWEAALNVSENTFLNEQLKEILYEGEECAPLMGVQFLSSYNQKVTCFQKRKMDSPTLEVFLCRYSNETFHQ